MPSPLDAPLDDHYHLEVTSLTQLLRVVRRSDDAVFGFTTMNRAVPYDDGNGLLNYDDGAAASSALNWKHGIEAQDQMEIRVLIDGVTVKTEDLRDGLWKGSRATVYEINYCDPTTGRHNVLIDGFIEKVEYGELAATFKIKSLRLAYDNVTDDLGFTVSPLCRKVFGGDDCGYPLLPAVWSDAEAVTAVPSDEASMGDFRRPSVFNGYDARCERSGTTGGSEPVWPTVLDATIDDPDAMGAEWRMVYARTVPGLTIASVASQSDFTVAGTGLVMPDGFFAKGRCRFKTTGNNVGLDPVEIKRFTADTGRVELALPAKRVLAVNDGIEMVGGCLHHTVACTDHGNYLRGLFLPLTPTADQVFETVRG